MLAELAQELRPGQSSLVAGHLGPEGLHQRGGPGGRDAEELLDVAARQEGPVELFELADGVGDGEEPPWLGGHRESSPGDQVAQRRRVLPPAAAGGARRATGRGPRRGEWGGDVRLDVGAGDGRSGSGPPGGLRSEICDGLGPGSAAAGGEGRTLEGRDEFVDVGRRAPGPARSGRTVAEAPGSRPSATRVESPSESIRAGRSLDLPRSRSTSCSCSTWNAGARGPHRRRCRAHATRGGVSPSRTSAGWRGRWTAVVLLSASGEAPTAAAGRNTANYAATITPAASRTNELRQRREDAEHESAGRGRWCRLARPGRRTSRPTPRADRSCTAVDQIGDVVAEAVQGSSKVYDPTHPGGALRSTTMIVMVRRCASVRGASNCFRSSSGDLGGGPLGGALLRWSCPCQKTRKIP